MRLGVCVCVPTNFGDGQCFGAAAVCSWSLSSIGSTKRLGSSIVIARMMGFSGYRFLYMCVFARMSVDPIELRPFGYKWNGQCNTRARYTSALAVAFVLLAMCACVRRLCIEAYGESVSMHMMRSLLLRADLIFLRHSHCDTFEYV